MYTSHEENYDYHQNPQVSVELIKGFVFEVPGDSPMEYRPLEVVFNEQARQRMMMMTDGGTDLDPLAFRDFARDVIRPSARGAGQIMIEYGWDETRCVVYLMFEVRGPDICRREVIGFYTTRSDMSTSRHIDTLLELVPNSHVVIHEAYTSTQHGRRLQHNVRDNEQILRPITVNRGPGQEVMGQYNMRPQDIFKTIQERDVAARNHGNPVIDNRASASHNGNIGTTSNRMNNMSSYMLSNLMSSYRQAKQQSSDTLIGATRNNMLGIASRYVGERRLDNNLLFQFLCQRSMMEQTGTITWGEIARIFPNADNEQFVARTKLPVGTVSNASGKNSWSDNRMETLVAHSINHWVPALMNRLLLIDVAFTVSNETVGGVQDLVFENVTPMFDDIADASKMQMFKRFIIDEMIPELLGNRVGSYTIAVQCNLLANNEIIVSLDGGHAYPYSAASYCDNLNSQVISNDKQHLNNTAMAINNMLESVIDVRY